MTITPRAIYTIGGTVQAGRGLYIEREADAELLSLCRTGAFAYVLTARQMGKSSLMTETAARLADEDIATVQIDLTLIGTALSADQWYLGLITEVADQLGLEADALAWWGEREHLGSAQRLAEFLREVVLREVATPIVIFVDEIDTTLSLDFTDDFYAAIRALYNARAQQPELARLAFVLIGVAIPGDLIKDPQRTPFNIGQQVQLSDFTPKEAQPFADGLGLEPAQAEATLARVFYWTSGHPYLTQRLCAAIAERQTADDEVVDVDALVHEIFLGERSKQDNNLQFVRDMLTRRAPNPIGVLTTYRRILDGREVPDDEGSLIKAHLKLGGVVRRENATLQVRNRIYAAAFNERWIKESLPKDYLPRRLQRGGLAAIGALAVLALFLGVFLFGSRSREAELQAQKNAAVAAQQTSEARRAEADIARATAEYANMLAEEANHATILQLMVADAQAALAAGDFDQARALAIAVLHANPELVQAQSVLYAAALVPSTRLRLTGHNDAANAVAYSPDGQTVASSSWDGTVRIWNALNGENLIVLMGHSNAVIALAYSPDGKNIASGSLDNTIRVWDMASQQSVRTLEGHNAQVNAVAYSPDGKTIVSGSNDYTLRIWDAASGQNIRTMTVTDTINTVAYSPDGKTIVSGSRDQTVRIWDAESGQSLHILVGHTGPVNAVAYSPDAKTIVSGSDDRTLRIWDVASGQILQTLKGHTADINAVAYSPKDNIIVSGGFDNVLRLWDVKSGLNIQTLRGHTGTIWDVAYSPDGHSIVSGAYDRTVRLWDLDNGQGVQILQSPPWSVFRAVAYLENGKIVVSGSDDGMLRIWDVASRQTVRTLQGHTSHVNAIAVSPDGNTMVSALADHTLQVWEVASGQTVRTLEGHTDEVNAVVYSPDAKTVVSGAKDGALRVWDMTTGQTIHTLQGHQGEISAVAYSPIEKIIVSSSNDLKLLVWNAETGQLIHTLQEKTSTVPPIIRALAFSPDGRTLISGAIDGTVQLWDMTKWQRGRVLLGHTNFITAVAFSPNGKYIVSGSYDHTLRLWDVASGQSLRTLSGHSAIIWCVAFSPDSQTVVSGGWDYSLRVWPLYNLDRIIDWTITHRYVPELTEEQRQRYGLVLESTVPATLVATQVPTSVP